MLMIRQIVTYYRCVHYANAMSPDRVCNMTNINGVQVLVIT